MPKSRPRLFVFKFIHRIRNGSPGRETPFVVQKATPTFSKNVFVGTTAESIALPNSAAAIELVRDNWFVPAELPSPRR